MELPSSGHLGRRGKRECVKSYRYISVRYVSFRRGAEHLLSALAIGLAGTVGGRRARISVDTEGEGVS